MKTKSNCASDGSVTLANGFFGGELYQLWTCVGISSNCIWWEIAFYLFTYFLFYYDMMFTAVCKFEILCEWEIL